MIPLLLLVLLLLYGLYIDFWGWGDHQLNQWLQWGIIDATNSSFVVYLFKVLTNFCTPLHVFECARCSCCCYIGLLGAVVLTLEQSSTATGSAPCLHHCLPKFHTPPSIQNTVLPIREPFNGLLLLKG